MATSQPLLRIARWNEFYENNRSRDIANLAYVLVQNDLSDDRYVFLIDHQDAAAHLGGWHAILMLASRVQRPYRGYLIRNDGKPHDARSIALATRLPIDLFKALIPRLLEIGLLEDANAKQRKSKALPSHLVAAKPQDNAAKPQAGDDRTEQNLSSSSNRIEKDGTEAAVNVIEQTRTEPRARESAAVEQARAATPSKTAADDDDLTPEQKLAGLFEQNSETLTADTLQRIREHLEVREIDFAAYVQALAPKLRPNGHIVSPTAIALDFAKKFGSKTTPARIPKRAKPEAPKCPECKGAGMVRTPDGMLFVPCTCAPESYKAAWAAKEAERALKHSEKGAA
jgi:hypothetical protein